MIIFGWRNRLHHIATGNMNCPVCTTHGAYVHQRIRGWFTLFFIPVFPYSNKGDIVTCSSCGTAFGPQVLSLAAPHIDTVATPSAPAWAPPALPARAH